MPRLFAAPTPETCRKQPDRLSFVRLIPLVRLLLIVCGMTFCLALGVHAQGAAPAAANVHYAGDSSPNALLDVYLPDSGSAPYPVVVMYPGSDADKSLLTTLGVPQFAITQGYAAVTVGYRTTLPEAYDDAFCALAWVYANAAQYGFDTGKVALYGASWGGLAAAYLATVTDATPYLNNCPNALPADYALRGVITNSGAFLASVDEIRFLTSAGLLNDLAALPADQLQRTLDALATTTPDQWCCLFFPPDIHDLLYRFPVFHVREGEPPHLLVQGLADETIPYQDTLNYVTALAGKGVSAELVLDADSGHLVGLPVYEAQMAGFLRRVFR
jgi:acetyl esterase/lipase